jgi:hypothetical protein
MQKEHKRVRLLLHENGRCVRKADNPKCLLHVLKLISLVAMNMHDEFLIMTCLFDSVLIQSLQMSFVWHVS